MPKTADFLNELIAQKNKLATALNTLGITSSTSETYNTLVGKVDGIHERSATDVGVVGSTVYIPEGYYHSEVSKSVSNGSVGNLDRSYEFDNEDLYLVTYNTCANSYALVVQANYQIAQTNSTGWITGGYKTGTIDIYGCLEVPAIEVTASTENDNIAPVVSINPVTTKQYIKIGPGYNNNTLIVDINAMPTMTLPTSVAAGVVSATFKASINPIIQSADSAFPIVMLDRYLVIPTGYNQTRSYYTIKGVATSTLTVSRTTNMDIEYINNTTPYSKVTLLGDTYAYGYVAYTTAITRGQSSSGTAYRLHTFTTSMTVGGTKYYILGQLNNNNVYRSDGVLMNGFATPVGKLSEYYQTSSTSTTMTFANNNIYAVRGSNSTYILTDSSTAYLQTTAKAVVFNEPLYFMTVGSTKPTFTGSTNTVSTTAYKYYAHIYPYASSITSSYGIRRIILPINYSDYWEVNTDSDIAMATPTLYRLDGIAFSDSSSTTTVSGTLYGEFMNIDPNTSD